MALSESTSMTQIASVLLATCRPKVRRAGAATNKRLALALTARPRSPAVAGTLTDLVSP